jgi:hypothetical protein
MEHLKRGTERKAAEWIGTGEVTERVPSDTLIQSVESKTIDLRFVQESPN